MRRQRRRSHDDRLGRGRLAPELRALIGGEALLESCDCFGNHTPKPGGMAVDRGHLRHHGSQPSVRGAEDDGVTAGEAGSPEADAVLVHFRAILEIRDGSPPVGDLLPRVDVLPGFAAAFTKPAVVMHHHHETAVGEGFGDRLEAVILGTGVAVSHGDPRKGATVRLGHEEPRRELDVTISAEPNVFSATHHDVASRRPGLRPFTVRPR